MAICKLELKSLSRHWVCRHLDLGPLSSRTIRNKWFLFKPPSLWSFVPSDWTKKYYTYLCMCMCIYIYIYIYTYIYTHTQLPIRIVKPVLSICPTVHLPVFQICSPICYSFTPSSKHVLRSDKSKFCLFTILTYERLIVQTSL